MSVDEMLEYKLHGDEMLIPAPDYPLWTAAVSLSGGKPVHYLCDEADDVLFFSFNGLSKVYRVAGFRSGWVVVSGAKHLARSYIEGMELLSSMRLCANVPGQHAIQTALGGFQSIDDLITSGGRLYEQREYAWHLVNQLPGVSCVKPKGALYLFPKLDPEIYPIKDDEKFVLELLLQEKVLVVQGTAFNWPTPDHFRMVFLPRLDDLEPVFERLDRFLKHYEP